ncbi:MAG: hypothetical protein HY908_34270 [Myxococcales bacterium]|nr:hypothetical protein [Myxococcales bacterium]
MARDLRPRVRRLAFFGIGAWVAWLGACNAVLGIEEAELDTSSNVTTSSGGGGGAECQNAGDCNDAKVCTEDSCLAGSCQHAPLHQVIADASAQTDNDCKQVLCIDGLAQQVQDTSDLPDDSNDCTVDTCNGATPIFNNAPAHTTCTSSGGAVCNGLGNCVECVTSIDCQGPEICNVEFGTPYQCACPKNCENQGQTCGWLPDDGCGNLVNCNGNPPIKDGTETDVNCGGLAAPNSTCNIGCATGKACVQNSDCVTGSCVGLVCQ